MEPYKLYLFVALVLIIIAFIINTRKYVYLYAIALVALGVIGNYIFYYSIIKNNDIYMNYSSLLIAVGVLIFTFNYLIN